jgi:hypothetical protein
MAIMANQQSGKSSGESVAARNGKKLLERAWDALLAEGLTEPVARRYACWMREYILFHNKLHPQEMGVPEVLAFLADARFSRPIGERVEAAAAVRFLYERVLHRHWPRGALEGPNENGANRSPGKLSAVYLNGRQPGVKLLDRVRNALRVGQYALDTEKTYVIGSNSSSTFMVRGIRRKWEHWRSSSF